MAKLTFHGGALSVTGANYLVETEKSKIVVDVGMMQGCPDCGYANYEPFLYNASKVDAVFITHAHIDHLGRLPKFIKEGFGGPVFVSEPTAGLAKIMLEDAHGILKEEAERKNMEPLYTEQDVDMALEYLRPHKYGERFYVTEDISARLRDAGHILGSSIIEIFIKENNKEIKLVFSGDLGNITMPLMNPPEIISSADYVIVESVYGNRIHESMEESRHVIERAIEDTVTRGGVLMIPAFALERTQELLFELNSLIENNRVPKVPVFLDSPLAIKATEIYKKFSHYFNKKAYAEIIRGDELFDFPLLKFTRTTEESKQINDVPPPKIIIAGSGMSTAGRILHHEKRYLPDPNSMLLFVGYQAQGTLGRRLYDGEEEVKIHGEKIRVRAKIKGVGGYSAHADQPTLVKWVGNIKGIEKVFCVQGEYHAAAGLAKKINEVLGVSAEAPLPLSEVELK
jgi:metallo-beta-lactamase family protein